MCYFGPSTHATLILILLCYWNKIHKKFIDRPIPEWSLLNRWIRDGLINCVSIISAKSFTESLKIIVYLSQLKSIDFCLKISLFRNQINSYFVSLNFRAINNCFCPAISICEKFQRYSYKYFILDAAIWWQKTLQTFFIFIIVIYDANAGFYSINYNTKRFIWQALLK